MDTASRGSNNELEVQRFFATLSSMLKVVIQVIRTGPRLCETSTC